MGFNENGTDCSLAARGGQRHEMAPSGTCAGGDCESLHADDKLFEMLLLGSSVEAAAVAAGLSRRTVFRRLADPEFRERLEKARAAVRDSVVQRLIDASGAAIDALWNLLEDEDEYVRIRASGVLLDGFAKVQRVMLQYADTVQETCQLHQHEQEPSRHEVLTHKTTKTKRSN